ncbi:universal stress protein [Microbacterium sp. JZ31]|uniref:universal stress protein n=1 Tax=Microbacterium sp. JZ31 TaxID=1906274 RepID=UPI00193123CD|nr:universal stress protein [Microbacterium sp. JZ31]
MLAVRAPGAEGQAALAAAVEEAALRRVPLVVATTPGASADAGGDARVVVLADPDDAEDLARIVEENEVALVVVGMRRREETGRFVVATAVMRAVLTLDAPVLVVRP